MNVKTHLFALAGMSIALILVMVGFALTFTFGAQFQKNICTIEGSSYTGGTCVSATNASVPALSDAYNSTADIIAAAKVGLGFLSLIILMAVIVIIIGMTRELRKSGM